MPKARSIFGGLGKLLSRRLKWGQKYAQELASGQYWDLLDKGFIKPEDFEPEITGLEFYFDAFRELSSCRPSGMDLRPIPFTAIVEYSRIYEVGDFEEFRGIIRHLDNTFLDLSDEANKKAEAKKNAKRN